MTSSLKLEVGKRYWRRDGEITEPLSDNKSSSDFYVFRNGSKFGGANTFTANGSTGWSLSSDLVEEVREPSHDFAHETDPVNRPAHYTQGGVECIEAIKAAMTAEAFAGYLRGNAVKYLWRYEHKGGVESLKKARWYLDRLITETA